MALADHYCLTGQAAEALHVNRLTIQRWINSGEMAAERVGYVHLIPLVEVERMKMMRFGHQWQLSPIKEPPADTYQGLKESGSR